MLSSKHFHFVLHGRKKVELLEFTRIKLLEFPFSRNADFCLPSSPFPKRQKIILETDNKGPEIECSITVAILPFKHGWC